MAMLNSNTCTDTHLVHAGIAVKLEELGVSNSSASSMLMKVDIEGSEVAFLYGAFCTTVSLELAILMKALTDLEFKLKSDFLTELGYGVPIFMGLETGDERNCLWTHNQGSI